MAVEIKICGVTRPVDAEFAAALGVNRIGVVFAWGPRVVEPALAREIAAAAGSVPVLGVVSGGSREEWIALAENTGIRGFQLHGESDPRLAQALQAEGLEVWRVAAVGSASGVAEKIARTAISADLVLLEPKLGGRSGGRGVPMDWNLAQLARAELQRSRAGLAGGLTPQNVKEAIALVQPDLVDVSSGVESSPGTKDPDLITEFVEAVIDTRAVG